MEVPHPQIFFDLENEASSSAEGQITSVLKPIQPVSWKDGNIPNEFISKSRCLQLIFYILF